MSWLVKWHSEMSDTPRLIFIIIIIIKVVHKVHIKTREKKRKRESKHYTATVSHWVHKNTTMSPTTLLRSSGRMSNPWKTSPKRSWFFHNVISQQYKPLLHHLLPPDQTQQNLYYFKLFLHNRKTQDLHSKSSATKSKSVQHQDRSRHGTTKSV